MLTQADIGASGMKGLGDSYILNSKTMIPIECLHSCLNLPVSVQIAVINTEAILDQALEAVWTFRPLSSAEVASLLERTRPVAQAGKHELYKTTNHFDGTAPKPEMLG